MMWFLTAFILTFGAIHGGVFARYLVMMPTTAEQVEEEVSPSIYYMVRGLLLQRA